MAKIRKKRSDTITTAQYTASVNTKSKGKVKVLGEYIDNVTKLQHQCTVCMDKYWCLPRYFSCIKCRNRSFTKTTEQYQDELDDLFNNTVKVVDEYLTAKIAITHKCTKCLSEWLAYPTHVLKGLGCSNCTVKKYKKLGNNYKTYQLGNRHVKVQGFEPLALDWLTRKYSANNIEVYSEGNIPSLHKEKLSHKPDIYIKSTNTLVEVKGNNTLGMLRYHNNKSLQQRRNVFYKVQSKAKLAKSLGYNYIVILVLSYNKHRKLIKLPEEWENLSYSDFRELWSNWMSKFKKSIR